jgi:hypothetical protein
MKLNELLFLCFWLVCLTFVIYLAVVVSAWGWLGVVALGSVEWTNDPKEKP